MYTSDNLTDCNKIGILLATYCEAANIEHLIDEIEQLPLNFKILVVDDSSPDGTAEIVKKVQQKYKNILLHTRPSKLGLGTAITDGFKLFLSSENPPTSIITLDADYSHNPQDIPMLLACMSVEDGLVIGSRYCKGGRVINWPVSRRFISIIANFIARLITKLNISDCTSGFRCYSTKFLSKTINNFHCAKYEIQIETIKQASLQSFKIKEVPVMFVNRKRGKSKLSVMEISGYFSYIFKIMFSCKL